MNIKCHIIEDEEMASKLLELYVSKLPALELVAVTEILCKAVGSPVIVAVTDTVN